MGLLIADFECGSAGRCKVGIRAARQTATVSGWLSPLFASVLVPGGVLLVPGTYGGVQVGDDSIRAENQDPNVARDMQLGQSRGSRLI